MAELKKCPFCGGYAEVRMVDVYTTPAVYVMCPQCLASTGFIFIGHPAMNPKTGKPKEETRYSEPQARAIAMSAWNMRAGNE